jgi:hypothetical protein
MATHVLTDAVLTINAVDLSDWCKSATIEFEAEAIDETAMGDTTRTNIGGLKSWSLSADLMQDYASSAVDQTLWSLVGTVVAVKLKATSAGNGATNPEYNGNALIQSYQPVGGSVGELHMTRLVAVSAGALSRATS